MKTAAAKLRCKVTLGYRTALLTKAHEIPFVN